MKPNLQIAPDSKRERVEVYFDVASKVYGLRKIHEEIKDGVYIEASKHIDMTLEQLEELIKDASEFIGIHKKY